MSAFINYKFKATSKKAAIMLVLAISFLLLGAANSYSQHRAMIETESQRGDHFEALLTFDKVSKRKLSSDSHIAAAKSAWALSLPDRAIAEFDAACSSPELKPDQELQIRFSKAIIHFQEGRSDEALMLSQKLLEGLPGSSALRARVLALAAQSLIRMGSKAQAEEKLVQAFADASYLERSDIAFQLGELQNQLGRWEEATQYLRTITSDDDRAPDALRLLIHISLSRKNYTEAEQWLNQGLLEFPDRFNDAWVYYARGLLAAHRADGKALNEILLEAQNKLAPSDAWLTLLQAEHEAFLASPIRARLATINEEGQANE